MGASENKKLIDGLIRDSKQSEGKPWKGTTREYLDLVQKSPEIAGNAASRIYNMIMKAGTSPIPDSEKLPKYEDMVEYKFFSDEVFGKHETIHDIMTFFQAGADRTGIGRRVLIAVGPTASAKSTITSLIKRGLENDTVPAFAIEDCPFREEPLHLVPRRLRAEFEKILGVKIEGDLCPVCRYKLNQEYKNDDDTYRWEEVPVVEFKFSEHDRMGIGTFQPSNPESQDIGELIGHADTSQLVRYGEGHPKGYRFDGELMVSNRGTMEYIEMCKADIKFHNILVSIAQEGLLKAPLFPLIAIDMSIISHTNMTEFEEFKKQKKNEALQSRMFQVDAPHELRSKDEMRIYDKLIRRSNYHKKVHIAPMTLGVAALFGVISRYKESHICKCPVKKAKLYNGEEVEQINGDPIDVKKLRIEGKLRGEGFDGIDARFIENAISIIAGQKIAQFEAEKAEKEKQGIEIDHDDKACINPIDVIRGLNKQFDHDIQLSPEEKDRYRKLLIGDKGSVLCEFKKEAKKKVIRAFIEAYDDQAQIMFENYVKEALAYAMKEKSVDLVTQEEREPDEKLMREIEEMIPVSDAGKKNWRQEIFVHQVHAQKQGKEFTYRTYLPLRDAIERKLTTDLRSVMEKALVDKHRKDEKTLKRRQSVKDNLKEDGYCDHCAEKFLKFVGDILRKGE